MRRYVITGAPGAGKTAVLRLLENQGYPVVEEAATDVIALDQALGHDEPWTDPVFVDRILALQQRRLARSPHGDADVVFFDRSPVCTLALSHHLGLPTSTTLAAAVDQIVEARVLEPCVFFVGNLGHVRPTAARRISFEESLVFERRHRDVYTELGYQLVDIPAAPVPDRVALALKTIARL